MLESSWSSLPPVAPSTWAVQKPARRAERTARSVSVSSFSGLWTSVAQPSFFLSSSIRSRPKVSKSPTARSGTSPRSSQTASPASTAITYGYFLSFTNFAANSRSVGPPDTIRQVSAASFISELIFIVTLLLIRSGGILYD